jgi:hypothetical protein
MYRVQASKLFNPEEQEKKSGPAGTKKILPVLP